ncbi:actin cortical patch SUR7/pH-response regulator pali [Lasiosphaeria miniovina]|uniref:Actin cortical patch SUR7/pH-response regulator pali n=1 Tax=Lasiosphaeria miniovina TaxID=1954250 RepID=A0AA40BID5_9PEZI|nr:actin cortical patch SUR7/pH-response regulator pali [Lasiosphaeria miniovina]KAK0734770.1 actin cortical patch SUR7/pH-response regulator pali [Lasiosphaeria miniovina]
MKQLSVAIPIVTSIAAFVLVLIALLAGSNQGSLEDYDIISNLIMNAANDDDPKPTQTSDLCSHVGGFLGKACATATAVAGSIESDIVALGNDIANDIADHLAEELGIHQFYSVHALTICEGYYSPNATAVGATRNVTSCYKALDQGYNVSAIFDHQLQVGPLELNLLDLGFTRDLQDVFDAFKDMTKAFVIILSLGVGLTGLSMLASVGGLFRHEKRGLLLANIVLAGLAAGLLTISSAVVTVAASKAASKANEHGNDIGISATAGSKYTAIIWAAVGLMFVTLGYWVWQLVRFRSGKTSNHHKRFSRETEAKPEMAPSNLHAISFSRLRGRR